MQPFLPNFLWQAENPTLILNWKNFWKKIIWKWEFLKKLSHKNAIKTAYWNPRNPINPKTWTRTRTFDFLRNPNKPEPEPWEIIKPEPEDFWTRPGTIAETRELIYLFVNKSQSKHSVSKSKFWKSRKNATFLYFRNENELPLERSGCFNYFTVGWINSVMIKAVRSGLGYADLFRLPTR